MISIDNDMTKRRLMIGIQLSVLLLILTGLFGAALIPPTPEPQRGIDLNNVAVTEPVDEEWEQLIMTDVRARAAYVLDTETGEVLYAKNAEEALPIASITKLMTSLLSYELIEESETSVIDTRALRQSGATGLREGDVLTIEDLSRLALISSSNDAAFALAASVGQLLGDADPAAQFVAGMNIRAEEIGLDTLEFKNPTGLDVSESEAGAVGSAADVSQLLAYILENHAEILEPSQLSAARIFNDRGSYVDVENTNQVLYAVPNLLASKTGYTDLAGGNLTIAFDAGFDRPIIVTVLGSTRQERFTDVLALVNSIRADLASTGS
jgi:D-alanyl-D-alanine carboxypeptidase